MVTKRLVGVALCALIVTTAAIASYYRSVALGTIELKGGTDYTTVNSLSFPDSASGSLKNMLGTGEAITEMTVVVRRKGTTGSQPTVGNVEIANGESTVSIDAVDGAAGSTADFSGNGGANGFPGSIGGSATAAISINVTQAAGSADMEFCFTPSVADKPINSGQDANTLERFTFDEGTDLIRHTISSMWRNRLAFYVTNVDDRFVVDQLDGSVTFPAGSSATISNVYLQDPSAAYSAPTGTSVSISGDTFSLTGFADLGEDESYEVVVVFSETFAGQTVKVLMEPTFTEE